MKDLLVLSTLFVFLALTVYAQPTGSPSIDAALPTYVPRPTRRHRPGGGNFPDLFSGETSVPPFSHSDLKSGHRSCTHIRRHNRGRSTTTTAGTTMSPTPSRLIASRSTTPRYFLT